MRQSGNRLYRKPVLSISVKRFAMRLSPQQQLIRRSVIGAVGRVLDRYWHEQKAAPLPPRIARLVDGNSPRTGGTAAGPDQMGSMREMGKD